MKPTYKAAAILAGAGALGIAAIAMLSKDASAQPREAVTWKPMASIDGFYPLQAGMIYGISDFTRGQPIAQEPLKEDFAKHELRVLDLTTTPPSDWPPSDISGEKGFVIFTPEKDVLMPTAALGSETAHFFVLDR